MSDFCRHCEVPADIRVSGARSVSSRRNQSSVSNRVGPLIRKYFSAFMSWTSLKLSPFLQVARKDLLMLDFEGVLKYFRITLPKKYRKPEATNILMKEAVRMKVKKLRRFETEYISIKEQEKNQMDPLERLQLDNKRLIEDMIRNEHIITELVLTKAKYEEDIQTLEEDLSRTKMSLKEVEDFNEKLKDETNSVIE